MYVIVFIFFHTVGTAFVCKTMCDYLSKNTDALLNLPYEDMKHDLLAYGIITSNEKRQFSFHSSKENMSSISHIIQSSLLKEEPRKLKQFLEVLEESGDKLAEKVAKNLGK